MFEEAIEHLVLCSLARSLLCMWKWLFCVSFCLNYQPLIFPKCL